MSLLTAQANYAKAIDALIKHCPGGSASVDDVSHAARFNNPEFMLARKNFDIAEKAYDAALVAERTLLAVPKEDAPGLTAHLKALSAGLRQTYVEDTRDNSSLETPADRVQDGHKRNEKTNFKKTPIADAIQRAFGTEKTPGLRFGLVALGVMAGVGLVVATGGFGLIGLVGVAALSTVVTAASFGLIGAALYNGHKSLERTQDDLLKLHDSNAEPTASIMGGHNSGAATTPDQYENLRQDSARYLERERRRDATSDIERNDEIDRDCDERDLIERDEERNRER